jgi:hypothetical protein
LLCRIALLRAKIRAFICEEISLLTVLYFPFRVLTRYTWLLTDLQCSVRPGFALANGAPVPARAESHLYQSAGFGPLTQ